METNPLETIPENIEPYTNLFNEYLHRIKDLIIFDEDMINHIRSFTQNEKMEIIVAMNNVICCLLNVLE
jgi:hypothetical protein